MDPEEVAAVMPCHAEPPARALLEQVRDDIGTVVVVDDGMPAAASARLHALAATLGVEVVTLPRHAGKGHALAAGIRHAATIPGVTAVLAIDADGQHPAQAVPRFLAAAARADLVVGDRLGDAARMPLIRRLANRLTNALLSWRLGCRIPDSQCGMRLIRGRALREVPLRPGGMEAETDHLIRCVRAGLGVTWVPIPAVYAGEASAFRPVRDGTAVLLTAVVAGQARTCSAWQRVSHGHEQEPPPSPLA